MQQRRIPSKLNTRQSLLMVEEKLIPGSWLPRPSPPCIFFSLALVSSLSLSLFLFFLKLVVLLFVFRLACRFFATREYFMHRDETWLEDTRFQEETRRWIRTANEKRIVRIEEYLKTRKLFSRYIRDARVNEDYYSFFYLIQREFRIQNYKIEFEISCQLILSYKLIINVYLI